MSNSNKQPQPPWPDADRETQSQAGGEAQPSSQFIVQRNGQLGHFTLQRQLGGGGFGHVYLAWDNKLRREVAIKVPRWDRPLTARTQERFLHEGRMLAQVHHPAIAAVFEVDVTDDGLPFVVMSYIRGRSMSQCLKEDEWTLEQQLRILIQIADTLQQAHKTGLTHRDLKPANIIVNDQLQISIVDFGLALHDDLAPSQMGDAAAVGTPIYMAPEQIRGENHLIDGRTDIWALGVIMYYMFTQRLPFASRDHQELVRTICYKHPRPVRQFNESIPKELERICLRCLQKLLDDRYPSMADVRDELQAFVQEQQQRQESFHALQHNLTRPSVQTLQSLSPDNVQAAQEPQGSGPVSHPPSGPSSPSSPSGTPSRSQVMVDVVPKGLRAFDQNDAEFFLQLLPGPYDRHGLPQSLRFLLGRLGTEHQVDSVPVVLVNGPSGSGKSSLIRAGLIPRLPAAVIPIYVDCTTADVSQAILDRLHREFDAMRTLTSLPELFRRIRQGEFLREGDKLLLILDQFEQWLSQPNALQPGELSEALRQCEAGRVQVVLLVRDDYWITLTQFLRELGLRIEDGRNALVMPLFDERHARRVLEMYGRAYGALPPGATPLNRQQKAFVEQAVAAITQQGKVVCVHLVVLAETIKNRDWGVQDYQALGGWEGIGREYIAGIFNDPQTPAYVKRHADDAWHILQVLLPQGANLLPTTGPIKGQALGLDDIQARAGLKQHHKRFEELINFLEFEARLIAPLEDEQALELDDQVLSLPRTTRLYGLTHDFLVAPIRAWGQAIQNESPAGRAEHLLQHLAQQWELTGDRRFLPSPWDSQRIARFASAAAKRKFAGYWKAAKAKALRQMLVMVALMLVAVGLLRERTRWVNRNRAEVFLTAPAAVSAGYVEQLPTLLSWAPDLFQTGLTSDKTQERFRAQCAVWLDESEATDAFRSLLERWNQAGPAEFAVILPLLKSSRQQLVPRIDLEFQATSDIRFKAKLAILAQYLGDNQLVFNSCRLSADPSLRTEIMDQWLQFNGGWRPLFTGAGITGTAGHEDVAKLPGDYLHAVFCTLAEIRESEIEVPELEWISALACEVQAKHLSAGAHAAAGFLLRRWNQEVTSKLEPPLGAEWRYIELAKSGEPSATEPQLFVRIPAGNVPVSAENVRELKLDSTTKELASDAFWISAYEVPHGLFEQFIQSLPPEHPALEILGNREPADAFAKSALPSSRLGFSSWLQALHFCNWLNDGVLATQPAYRFLSADDIQRNEGVSGFRLPTFAEHDLALRGRSTTEFYFGDQPSDLIRYAGLENSNPALLPGLSPPNGFGCFDMLGNHREWIENHFSAMLMHQAFSKGGDHFNPYLTCRSGYTFGQPNNGILAVSIRLVLVVE